MFAKTLQRFNFFIGTKVRRRFAFADATGATRHFCHRGTKPDRSVIKDIFVRRAYSTQKMARHQYLAKAYDTIISTGKVPLIIDAGANIGASAIWFSNGFPKGHVIAIEPEDGNFELLARNCVGFNIEPLKAAIGSSDEFASVVDPGRGEWGYQTVSNEQGACRRIAIQSLLTEKKKLDLSPLILKVDIEGGEDDLFDGDTCWIDEFPLIIIELHDWMLPGQGTSRSFLKAVSKRDRDFLLHGENIFSFRN